MQSLAARLRRNPLTKHLAISAADPTSIEATLAILDRAAMEKILGIAKATFLSTARAATQSAKANSARAVRDAADAGKKLGSMVTQAGSHVARRIGGVTQLGKDRLKLP